MYIYQRCFVPRIPSFAPLGRVVPFPFASPVTSLCELPRPRSHPQTMSSDQKSIGSQGPADKEKHTINITPYTPPVSNRTHTHVQSGGGGEAGVYEGKEAQQLQSMGYQPEENLVRNRGLFTLLFQALAIAAIPYGFGAPSE